jgi:hypothetical protein
LLLPAPSANHQHDYEYTMHGHLLNALVTVAGMQDGFATSAFGRKPTFLGATLAGDEVVATGVVYKVTEEQYTKQVRVLGVQYSTVE